MFRGATTISLDSKGRLAIPAKYRNALSIDCEGKMVCTIDIKQPCLLLYPLPEWQIIEKKLTQLSSMNPAERRLQRLLLGHADDCEMDKNGRLLLSAPLRQHAGLDKKLMLVGQLNKFEIWDEAAWHDQIAQDMDVERDGEFILNERLEDFSL
ncbi:MAG: cell division/cell wall cluster transcriptional repressor MraZ [Idiomarina sp.]|jgi:MraZ protein|uniref:Transcriptional regulator MraZ n=1 Tax=Idiomarina aquatica TaxID=1327752 RepID=A0A4R6P5M2_9GAMM|nr:MULTISPECIES: division/cell wall cluster transcriptional repressor MraZ [Idiomarina]MAK72366.1 cell division/cell wall cluster transcriptional repressor MraZ [Idiomarinaceae bacterium]MBL4741567.1 division/cell wall cluster transcriptional repressor MraZ [Idiomarina sp.]MBT43748.1 cell division/cell wall cluster transcriptional repressor MraZ [Idiomarina sp.]PHQ77801.1 MAG: cell division/cell wall cluster transcriptional repressor MraZ [Idiomarina sp.]TDP32695.1 division/cell wall cluster t